MQNATLWRTLLGVEKTVIEAINRASSSELGLLATLIKATKIPKDHDKIVEAWKQRRQEMLCSDEDFGVTADLLEQKETAKRENEEELDRATERSNRLLEAQDRLRR